MRFTEAPVDTRNDWSFFFGQTRQDVNTGIRQCLHARVLSGSLLIHFIRTSVFDLMDYARSFLFHTRQDKHWKKALPARMPSHSSLRISSEGSLIMHGFSSVKLDKTNHWKNYGSACSGAVLLFDSHLIHFFRRPLFDLMDHEWSFFFQTRQDKHWKRAVPARVAVSLFAQLIHFFRRPLLDLMDPAQSFFFGRTRQDTQTHTNTRL